MISSVLLSSGALQDFHASGVLLCVRESRLGFEILDVVTPLTLGHVHRAVGLDEGGHVSAQRMTRENLLTVRVTIDRYE